MKHHRSFWFWIILIFPLGVYFSGLSNITLPDSYWWPAIVGVWILTTVSYFRLVYSTSPTLLRKLGWWLVVSAIYSFVSFAYGGYWFGPTMGGGVASVLISFGTIGFVLSALGGQFVFHSISSSSQ